MSLLLPVRCSTLMSFTSAYRKSQPQISSSILFHTSSTYPWSSVAASIKESPFYQSYKSPTNQVLTVAEIEHDQLHVLVITFPFGPNPALLLNTIHRLAADAPEAIFSFLGTAKSLFGLVDAATNIKFYEVEDGTAEDYALSGNPLEEIDLFMKAAPNNFNKAIDKAVSDGNKKVTCVVSDALVWMSGTIAEEFRVPWVAIWTICSTFLAFNYEIDLTRETLYGMNSNGEPSSLFPGMSLACSSDLPPWEFCYDDEQMMDMVCKAIPRATAVAANSFEELEDPSVIIDLKSRLKLFLSVGPFFAMARPLLASDPHGCISWLDGHKLGSVVYVSFQTMTPPPQEFVAFAEGLEASGLPFIWSIEDDTNAYFPVGFAERTRAKGKIVPSAPHSLILQHPAIGVFVTQSGWAGVMESIVAGVPIIYRPTFGDQMVNGVLIHHTWQIGITCCVLTKEATTFALDLLMHTEHGKRMKYNIQSLKEMAKQAVGPDGSTTNNFKTLSDIVFNRPN